jgi:methylated-DNA-[protein]-cysteine S-methyltransferase
VKPEDQGFPDLGRWVQEVGEFEEGGVHNTETARQLDAYFAGELKDFDVPLDVQGTDFQQLVWKQLTAIPYGETWSYGEMAAAIGKPSASRAVGHANGRNPVSIIVPCHRVIGSSGKLVGYGGGLDRKQALLALESPGQQAPLL